MGNNGTVIVTGGASGLGAAVAEAVAREGWKPHVLDVNRPASSIDHTIVDVGDTRHAEAVARIVAEKAEQLRAVVTCAAVDYPGDFAETEGETWDRIVQVNLLGTAAVIRGALPWLIATGGTIVTVASTLGMRPLAAASAYSAAKFGVVGMTRTLALELGGRVGVTLLIPGGMRTGFFDNREEAFRPSSDQRLNDPSDVARAVVFSLQQSADCEIREIVITPSVEPSWP